MSVGVIAEEELTEVASVCLLWQMRSIIMLSGDDFAFGFKICSLQQRGSHHLSQTADSMVVVVGLSGSGQSVKFPPTMYAFDTSEVYREDTLRGSKRWSKCAWETTGKKMIVTSKVRQTKTSGELVYTQKDVWQLNDLKTMQIVITQSFAQGDSVHSERRIFHLVM